MNNYGGNCQMWLDVSNMLLAPFAVRLGFTLLLINMAIGGVTTTMRLKQAA